MSETKKRAVRALYLRPGRSFLAECIIAGVFDRPGVPGDPPPRAGESFPDYLDRCEAEQPGGEPC